MSKNSWFYESENENKGSKGKFNFTNPYVPITGRPRTPPRNGVARRPSLGTGVTGRLPKRPQSVSSTNSSPRKGVGPSLGTGVAGRTSPRNAVSRRSTPLGSTSPSNGSARRTPPRKGVAADTPQPKKAKSNNISQIKELLKSLYMSQKNINELLKTYPNVTYKKIQNAIKIAQKGEFSIQNVLNSKHLQNESNNEPNEPNENIPVPENSITNAAITRIEQNLHNYEARQCYRNSVLHLLLSIIKNELRNRNRNGNINNTFNSFFGFREENNREGSKNNFKIFLRSMLLGERPMYETLFTTFYNNTRLPIQTEYNDAAEYLGNLIGTTNNLFSVQFKSKINLHTSLDNDVLINFVRLNQILGEIENQPNMDYIIINFDRALQENLYNLSLNLNDNFVLNGNNYMITDIIYYGSLHYVSLNKRNNTFYLYNDLDRRRTRRRGNDGLDKISKPLEIPEDSDVIRRGRISELPGNSGYSYSDFRPRIIMLTRQS